MAAPSQLRARGYEYECPLVLDLKSVCWMPLNPLYKALSLQMARLGTHPLCCPGSLSPQPTPQNARTTQVERPRLGTLLPHTLAHCQSRVVLTSH